MTENGRSSGWGFNFLNHPEKITMQKWAKDSRPFISISCITFNHEKFIRNALDGILMQETTFPVEILIHDDASTDNTSKIIQEYERKYPDIINPIYQSENQYSKNIRIGPNFQYPRVKGKYYAPCEGDDYWIDPYKLQKQVDFLEANLEYVICGHDRRRVDEHNQVILETEKLYGPIKLYTQCVVFRSAYLEDFSKYIAPKLTIGDFPLFLYLSIYGKSKVLDFIGACYRVSDSGVWGKKGLEERFERRLPSYDALEIYFKKHNHNKQLRILYSYKERSHLKYLIFLIKRGQFLKGCLIGLKVLEYKFKRGFTR